MADLKHGMGVKCGSMKPIPPADIDILRRLDRARGLSVELILKDISTVRYDASRLWEWEKIAMRVAEEYGG